MQVNNEPAPKIRPDPSQVDWFHTGLVEVNLPHLNPFNQKLDRVQPGNI